MRLLSTVGLISNFCGTVCLAYSLLLTNGQIKSLSSGAYWERNLHLGQSLINTRNFALLGIALIFIGLVFQIFGLPRQGGKATSK